MVVSLPAPNSSSSPRIDHYNGPECFRACVVYAVSFADGTGAPGWTVVSQFWVVLAWAPGIVICELNHDLTRRMLTLGLGEPAHPFAASPGSVVLVALVVTPVAVSPWIPLP